MCTQTKLNCEVLQDDQALEIRWAIAGESIVMQLVGRIGKLCLLADTIYNVF